MPNIETPKPLFLTFAELAAATAVLHMHEKRWVDGLHDVWKVGAPAPSAIIRNPKAFDERSVQAGNHVERLILPTKFAEWVCAVSAARGHPYSMRQAMAMLHGEVDYGFDQIS